MPPQVKSPYCKHCKRSEAFTLVEILVVVAIVAILAGLLAANYGPALANVKQSRSSANLRILGSALGLYLGDNENLYPLMCEAGYAAPYWSQGIAPYLPESRTGYWKKVTTGAHFRQSPALMDPLLRNDRHQILGDYGVNNAIFRYNKSRLSAALLIQPSRTVTIMTAETPAYEPSAGSWFIETVNYVADPNYPYRPGDRGTGKILALFGDGHTEAIPLEFFIRDRADLLLPRL